MKSKLVSPLSHTSGQSYVFSVGYALGLCSCIWSIFLSLLLWTISLVGIGYLLKVDFTQTIVCTHNIFGIG